MKRMLAIFTFFFASFAIANEFPIEEVIDMQNKDKDMRLEWIRNAHTHKGDHIGRQIQQLEAMNTARLKAILDTYGLPTDEEAIEAVTSLVFFSSDLRFQQEFLSQVSKREEWAYDLDELTDRILVKQGLPQKFGTQFQIDQGQLIPYPIEDSEFAKRYQKEQDIPPTEYLQKLYAALYNDDVRLFYKLFFNLSNDFFENADDYLYYTTFEPGDFSLNEKGEMVAYEDPGVSIFHALIKKTTQDALVGKFHTDYHFFPTYVYLVPKAEFEPADTMEFNEAFKIFAHADEFLSRPFHVFHSKRIIPHVEEFALDSPAVGFALTGVVEVPEFSFREELLYHFYFTATPQFEASWDK